MTELENGFLEMMTHITLTRLTTTEENKIKQSLWYLYSLSERARNVLDNIDDKHHLTISNVKNQCLAGKVSSKSYLGKVCMSFDSEHYFVNPHGNLNKLDFKMELIHEIIHAILKKSDNYGYRGLSLIDLEHMHSDSRLGYAGDTVTLVNTIRDELGIARRMNYIENNFTHLPKLTDDHRIDYVHLTQNTNLKEGANNLVIADQMDFLGFRDSAEFSTGAGADYLWGSKKGDYLSSGGGNDRIHGLAGNDTLVPGTGINYVDGGKGYDTLELEGKSKEYQLLPASHTVEYTGKDKALYSHDTFINIEKIVFNGDGIGLEL